MKRAIALLALGLLAGGWLLWDGTGDPAKTGPGGDVDLARGAQIYDDACAACHGADLEGAPNWRQPGSDGRLPAPPHDASGHTWHHSDRVLLAIIAHGSAAVVGGGYESDMPGFADSYSDAELSDVLAYIKSRWPEEIRAHQARITAEALAD